MEFMGKAWEAITKRCIVQGWREMLLESTPEIIEFYLYCIWCTVRALPGEGRKDLEYKELVELAKQELQDEDIVAYAAETNHYTY